MTAVGVCAFQLLLCSSAIAAKPPNFVIILTDDQSWVGSSLQIDPGDNRTQSDYYRTPQIERLASMGMRFTSGYSPAPFCCPTRRSLLIGQTPARHIYQKDQRNWTTRYREQLSFPKMLKQANPNYRAAHFGKWDMRFDDVTPSHMGYDISDGLTGNGTGGGKGSGGPASKDDPKLIFEITDRACDFMEKQVDSGNPFFVQVSHYAVHLDIFYREDSLKEAEGWTKGSKHSMPEFAAMTRDVDQGIGMVLDKIKSLGLENNTYVFFLSDNGGRNTIPKQKGKKQHRNYPLNNGKGSMYEGGIRVPFIVIGPGIEPNTVSRVPVTGLDIFPTIADLAGYKLPLPKQLDGGSMKSVLSHRGNGEIHRTKPFLIFHQAVARNAQSALIQGGFKLVKTWKDQKLELFNLSESISEEKDLSIEFPEKTRKLHTLMTGFLDEVKAETRKVGSKKEVYEKAKPLSAVKAVPYANNGGLKMLYDNRQYPQAIAHEGKVHLVWRGKEGFPYIRAYDLKSRTFSESHMLLERMEDTVNAKKYRTDHHYAPVIWMDLEGYLHTMFGCHNSPGVHLISKKRNSMDGWTQGPPASDSMSYPKIHQIHDGKTLVYFRHTGHLGEWQYRVSSDGGKNWDGPPLTTIDLNAEPQDGIHASHAGSYNTTAVSKDGTRLHIAFIWKVEDPVFNERYQQTLTDHTQRYNLYYLFVDLPTGQAFNIYGEAVNLPLRKKVADEKCLVWDTDERVAAVGPSICLDEHGLPHFTLPVSDETPLDSHFYYVSRKAGKWVHSRITETLHPFNASHLEQTADGGFRAFLIAGDGEKIVEKGMDEYGWGQRVEEWTATDNGTTWQLTRELTPIKGDRYQNVQPVLNQRGRIENNLLLFYGWNVPSSPGTAYLWDAR